MLMQRVVMLVVFFCGVMMAASGAIPGNVPPMALVEEMPGSGNGQIYIMPAMSTPSLKNGETATIQAVVHAVAGVASVEAHIDRDTGAPVCFDLPVDILHMSPAASNNAAADLWYTEWTACGLEEGYYRVVITVKDNAGNSYTDRSLRFTDPIAGNNVVGTTSYLGDPQQQGYIKGTQFAMLEPGMVDIVHFYSHEADGEVRMGLYDDSPDPVLLWQSAPEANTVTGGWIDIPASVLLSVGNYYIAWQVYTTQAVPSYASGTPGDGLQLTYAWDDFPALLEFGTATEPTYTPDLWSAYITYTGPPATPTDPSAMAIETNSITWTWQDNADNESGYKVYDGPGATAPLAVTHTTGADVGSWQHAGLAPNTQYAFQVAATNAVTDSAKTVSFSAWTLAATPVAPVVNSPTTTTLNLSINAGDSNPIGTEYAIRCLTTGQWVQGDGSLAASEDWQTAATWANTVVTGLTGSTNYSFAAKARNGVGIITAEGASSSAWTQVTLAYTAGSGGTITGASPQFVNYGGTGTEVTAQPDACYSFIDWSDGSTANPRTDIGVTADITVTANFGFIDLTEPVITCPPAPAALSLNGSCQALLPDLTVSASATDNCTAFPVITQSPSAGTTISTDTVVTLRATDDAGNFDECAVTVTVVDDTNPVITCPPAPAALSLDADCEAQVPDLAALTSAIDNCTASPVITQSPTAGATISTDTTVTLRATDASGNFDECSVAVTVVDSTAPVITLLGDDPYTIILNDTYADPGAIATDFCEGDLSAMITVNDSEVNTSVAGDYEVTYNVSDGEGNAAAEVTRTVTVVDPGIPLTIAPLADIMIAEGASYDWSAVASGGTGVYTYQWFLWNDGASAFEALTDGPVGAGAYEGVTTATLRFNPFTETMAGLYKVEVSDSSDTVEAQANVVLEPPLIPVAGVIGMLALASATAIGGALALRRRR